MKSTAYRTPESIPAPAAAGALGTVRTPVTTKGHTGPRQRINGASTLAKHGVLTGPGKASRQERAWCRLDALRRYTGSAAQRMCGLPRLEAVDLWHVSTTDGVRVHGLMSCKSPSRCPRCADRIARPRRDALQRTIARWIDAGGRVAMVTLTMRHHHMPLGQGVSILLKSWSDMWQGRRRETWDYLGLRGAVRTLEATHGTRNGWHPHMHALFFAAPGTDWHGIEAHLRAQWSKRVDCSNVGVRLDPIQSGPEHVARAAGYLAKGAANEVVYGQDKGSREKGRVTPFELLDVRSSRARSLWCEWEAGIKGRRAHGWVMRAQIETVTGPIAWTEDAQLQDDDTAPDVRPHVSLSRETWIDLRRIRAVALLLAIVRRGLDTRMLLRYDAVRRTVPDGDLDLLRRCVMRC